LLRIQVISQKNEKLLLFSKVQFCLTGPVFVVKDTPVFLEEKGGTFPFFSLQRL